MNDPMNTEPVQSAADQKLQTEFNRWATDGRGEEMERHHADITAQTLALMDLRPGERVLDLGCGAGWATRLLAQRVAGDAEGRGAAIGLDVSDEMLKLARVNSIGMAHVQFVWGSAESIPAEEGFFDKVLSVESFYYYADQGKALDELRRVLTPGGELFILINLYKDNHYSLRWADALQVPVQVRSEAEYVELLVQHGFEARALRVPDHTPTPEVYSGKWFRNAEELRDFKRIGALLLIGKMPA